MKTGHGLDLTICHAKGQLLLLYCPGIVAVLSLQPGLEGVGSMVLCNVVTVYTNALNQTTHTTTLWIVTTMKT